MTKRQLQVDPPKQAPMGSQWPWEETEAEKDDVHWPKPEPFEKWFVHTTNVLNGWLPAQGFGAIFLV